MAEDQSVNGDRWNDQFSKLLQSLNWNSLGDSNMDLRNERDKKHGVDRLCIFQESLRGTRQEASLVEAKNYKTTSYTSGLIGDWIITLDNKLVNLKTSNDLLEKFEVLSEMPLRTGIIAIWFSDFTDYQKFKPKFIESLKKVKLNRKQVNPNKIYVLENDAILKLASLSLAIQGINSSKDNKTEFKFFYPTIETLPATRSNVLNPNYFTAKFILGDYKDSKGVENKVVFYFGKLNLPSFQRLQQALAHFAYLDDEKPLTLFIYQRDQEEFRKIKPEVENLFSTQPIKLKSMENMSDLPTFMID